MMQVMPSDTDDDGATALEEFVRDTDPAAPDLEEQRLTWNAPSFLVTDQEANIELVYDTSDNNEETDGLAFKLFYNSTVVGQAIDEGFIFGESRVDSGASVEDSGDEDDNPATDRYQLFEWAPAQELGQGRKPAADAALFFCHPKRRRLESRAKCCSSECSSWV